MQLFGAVASHVGNLREANQDRAWFKGSVAAVADGMGGHQGGERAAELAIGEFKIMPPDLTPAELIDVVEEANRQVHKQSTRPELRGMGTTMVAMGLHSNRILVVNVGDSRAYRLRHGELVQITVDHSFVEELVRQGRLTPEEAAVHPQRNIVTRALGIGPSVEVDEFSVEPEIGDRFLLASDGLFGEVSAEQMRRILDAGDDPGPTSVNLVKAALATPCRDNVTVAVVDVVDDDFDFPPNYQVEQVIDSGDRDITAPVPIISSDGSQGLQPAELGAPAGPARAGNLLERERTDTNNNGADHHGGMVSTVNSGGPARIPRPSAVASKSNRTPLLAVGAAGLLVVGLVFVSFFGVRWYSNSSYFVGEVEGQLAIYQGRKGGFLWTDPVALDYRSGVYVTALSPESISEVESWGTFSSPTSAQAAIETLAARQTQANEQPSTTVAEAPTTRSTGSPASSSTTATTGGQSTTNTPPPGGSQNDPGATTAASGG